MQQLLYDIFQAYYQARSNKRNSLSQLWFEYDYESLLVQLWQDLSDGNYKIGTSRCFLICDTVPREIFAADFRDRVVHHLVYNYIYHTCDKQFIYDSYSCRVGKGTHFWAKRLDHFIRSCTHNYTQDAWILKLDIKWFFMCIDKDILAYRLWQTISYRRDSLSPMWRDWLWSLCKQIIYHDPTLDYNFCWARDLYDVLPPDKSLFHSSAWYGLPIGNLTSQLLANVYLHLFDLWMKETVGCQFYGRYVDDFVIVHTDRHFLKQLIPKIRYFLQDQLSLTLHPRKMYLQYYTKWIKFLGHFILPYRRYIDKRTIYRSRKRFDHISPTSLWHISFINSYLWLLKHGKSFYIRKRLASGLSDHFDFNTSFTKARIHVTCRKSTSL